MTSAVSRFDLSAGEIALDFANTWADRGEDQAALGYSHLVEWSAEASILDASSTHRLVRGATLRPEDADAVLAAARDLARAIHGVFHELAAGRDDVDALNRILAAALPRLRLRRGGACCTWTWSAGDKDLDRMLWPVARSAADLLTSDRIERVRECASPTCSWLFVDGSRNRSRKWCDMAICGNRAKAKRFYRRHRHTESGSG